MIAGVHFQHRLCAQQAQVLLGIDSTKYGVFDASDALTGLWEVGARVDGSDPSAGISAGLDFEGLVTLPVVHGDVTLDGVVNLSDLTVLAANYGSSEQGLGTGDVNGDGLVNLSDLTILASNYGMTTAQVLAGSPGVYTTPEPTTVGMLVLGAMALIRRRK